MESRPNILFALADQLGARWLPTYGNSLVQTPRLDAFAQESAVFERAVTTSPICTPWRGCLFSGLYPSQTGITDNGMAYPRGLSSLADRLNASGYATHWLGKWHLSGAPQQNRAVPTEARAGFQHFIGWESHHVDHWRGLIWADDSPEAIPMRGHETDSLTDLAVAQLRDAAKAEKPFFMAVSYQAPHPPCAPPDEYLDMYANRDLLPEPNADSNAWFKHEAWKADYGVAEFRQRYFGEISHLDAAVGRLLDALDALDMRDNTVVIFTSDHGEMAGAHGLFGKGVMYEESLHVPLVIRAPGQKIGHRTEICAATIDLLPTLLDYADWKAEAPADGISLRPYIESDTDAPDRIVISEHRNLCATTRDWKLVTRKRGGELSALYNLREDPCELDNRLEDPLCAGIVNLLDDELRRWRQRITANRQEAA